MKYITQTRITIPNAETIDTPYLGGLDSSSLSARLPTGLHGQLILSSFPQVCELDSNGDAYRPGTVLFYSILYYTTLYYTILYYTILYYTILYYTILYYTILYYILYYTILYMYFTLLYYYPLLYSLLYSALLYYTIHFLYCQRAMLFTDDGIVDFLKLGLTG